MRWLSREVGLVAAVILVVSAALATAAAFLYKPAEKPEPYEMPVPVDSVRLTSQAPGEWWATELPDGTRCVVVFELPAVGRSKNPALQCSFPEGPKWGEKP